MVSCKDSFTLKVKVKCRLVRVILMLNYSLLTAVVGWLFHAKAISGIIYSPPSIKTAHYTLNMTLRFENPGRITLYITLQIKSIFI